MCFCSPVIVICSWFCFALQVLLLFILACDILVFMLSSGPFRVAPYIRVVFLIMTIRYVFICTNWCYFCYHNEHSWRASNQSNVYFFLEYARELRIFELREKREEGEGFQYSMHPYLRPSKGLQEHTQKLRTGNRY